MSRLWLLDTCVVSEQTRPSPDPAVQAWLGRHLDESAIAAVSIGEIRFGVESLPVGLRRNSLVAWAQALQERMSGRTLPTDLEVWNAYGRLRASLLGMGRPAGDPLDILIAATALVHGLTLVTRNTRHFKQTGVPLMNPWTASTP